MKKLHRLLRKTIADQVSDLFINSLNPINSMLAFAERGKKQVRDQFDFRFKHLVLVVLKLRKSQSVKIHVYLDD